MEPEEFIGEARGVLLHSRVGIPRELRGSFERVDVLQEAWIKILPQMSWLMTLDARSRRTCLRHNLRWAWARLIHRELACKRAGSACEESPDSPEDLEAVASSWPGPSELADLAEAGHALMAGLDRLPEAQRRVLQLYYHEGLSCRQIARELESTPKAVERCLARGRAKLACTFNDVCPNVRRREF